MTSRTAYAAGRADSFREAAAILEYAFKITGKNLSPQKVIDLLRRRANEERVK